MMKTLFSLSLASAAVAEEDCLSDANVLLQIKQAEHGSLNMDDMEIIAGAEMKHESVGKRLDEADHGVNDCDRWCQLERHRQEMCSWDDIQRNMPAERFCEDSDPNFAEHQWDTMHLEHEYCLKRQECTHNELIHPQWIEHPEWHVAPNDPVQQCLDEAHDLIDWCNGDLHCRINSNCEKAAELEGINHDDHEVWDQHWQQCWHEQMFLAPRDINCQQVEQEDHEAHEICVCENECSDNWTKWFFNQEGKANSDCIHKCHVDHSDESHQWLLQTRNRAQSYAKRYASKSNLQLIQQTFEGHHEEEQRRSVWDEISQTHEECNQGISEDDFFSQLPVANFCSHTTAGDVWCVMEHACVHTRQNDEEHRECMHHQQIEHDMCDVWCQIDHICAPHHGEGENGWEHHHQCFQDQKKLRPAEDFCDYCKDAGNWGDDPHNCMERCVAEHQCTDNWTKEWIECPLPSPWSEGHDHKWHDWYQEEDVAQCLHYVWNPEQEFHHWIPDGCFPNQEHDTANDDFDATGTWTDAAGVDTTFEHDHHDEHEDQCMGDCTYQAEHCEEDKRECGKNLFECAAICHPILLEAGDEAHECASHCDLLDFDCQKGCFEHLFEDHDHHHEEGNYTDADGNMHHDDMHFDHNDTLATGDAADMMHEDDSTYWGTAGADGSMHHDDEWNTDSTSAANTDWNDDHHNSDSSTLFDDVAWNDEDTTMYHSDGTFTNAADLASTEGSTNWLAQVRSRNQLKNRMLLHKNRKPRPPSTVYVYRK